MNGATSIDKASLYGRVFGHLSLFDYASTEGHGRVDWMIPMFPDALFAARIPPPSPQGCLVGPL